MAPKGEISADESFPPAGLAFMDAERDGLCKGVPQYSTGQPHVVHHVSCLMEHRKNIAHESFWDYARGNSGIVRMDPCRKGVAGEIESRIRRVRWQLGKETPADF